MKRNIYIRQGETITIEGVSFTIRRVTGHALTLELKDKRDVKLISGTPIKATE